MGQEGGATARGAGPSGGGSGMGRGAEAGRETHPARASESRQARMRRGMGRLLSEDSPELSAQAAEGLQSSRGWAEKKRQDRQDRWDRQGRPLFSCPSELHGARACPGGGTASQGRQG